MPLQTVTLQKAEDVEAIAQVVSWRGSWSSTWQDFDHAYCLQAKWGRGSANNSTSAIIRFGYGRGMRAGEKEIANVLRETDRERFYIRVAYPADYGHAVLGNAARIYWYGQIDVEANRRMGAVTVSGEGGDPDETVEIGKQQFVAYGLAALFERQQITKSWAQYLFAKQIPRGLTFNYRGRPNRSFRRANRGAYVFSNDVTGARYWSSDEILDYLIAYHPPADWGGSPLPISVRHPPDILPKWDTPELPTHRQTLARLFSQLWARYRLMGWRVDVDPTTNEIEIVPYTFSDDSIALPNGEQIPGNYDQRRLVIDDAPSARAVIRIDTSDQVDQIVMQGTRRRACFTISIRDGTLDQGWTDADELAFSDGARNADDYPAAAEVAEREKRDRQARAAIAAATGVLSRFILVENFAGVAKDGEGNGSSPIDPDENGFAQRPYLPELQLLRKIPLRRDVDYSGNKIDHGDAHEYERPDLEMPPIVVAYLLEDPENENTKRWHYMQTIGQQAAVEEIGDRHPDRGNQWSATVSVDSDARALWIRVTGGDGQQEMEGFYSTSGFDFMRLVATVAVETDGYCQGVWPAGIAPLFDVARVLTIDAGAAYRLDYVCPGTVVGVEPTKNELIRTDSGGYVRDDRELLQGLAKVAFQWYGAPRKAIEWETTWATIYLEVGNLIMYLGPAGDDEEINAVITDITVTSQISEGGQPVPVPRWQYKTQFGELDVLRL